MTDDEIRKALTGLTVPVEVAGRALGLGRNAAYQAAKVGQIPAVKVGGRYVVPAAKLRRLLGIEAA